MTGFDGATILASLRYVLMLVVLQGIDWVFGVLLAFRAGTFKVSELPKALLEIGTYIFGLALLAVGTGIQFKFGELDAGPALTVLFTGAAVAYGLKLLKNIAEKAGAFPTPTKAKAYFDKPGD